MVVKGEEQHLDLIVSYAISSGDPQRKDNRLRARNAQVTLGQIMAPEAAT